VILSQEYGWSPQQIGELTLAQAVIYASGGEHRMGGRQGYKSLAAALAAVKGS
jgi:hypothetical protein